MKEFERRTLTTKLSDRPSRAEIEGKRMKGTFVLKTYATEARPQYEFILSEDQQITVEMVREIASRHNMEVKVVDVTRENVLFRAIRKEFRKTRVFPTIVSDSGISYKGPMSKEKIEDFLSKVARD
jgi:hypothetical protein